MKIVQNKNPFPHLIIENTYDVHELNLIWQELEFLTYKNKLESPSETNSAKDSNGNVLKSNHGTFLDDCYKRRDLSNILTVNRKIFDNEYKEKFAELSFAYQQIHYCNTDNTLISYYENNDYYFPHHDESLFTILTWFYKTPKSFIGGNLVFPEYDYEVEIKNNMTLFFPSYLKHSVTKLESIHTYPEFSGYGRYCMTQFIHFIPRNPN